MAAKRIYFYLREMFPLVNIIGLFLFCASIFSILSLTTKNSHQVTFFISNPDFWILSSVFVVANLVLRIMDELKDYKDDLINFPMRPLVTQAVYHKDLYLLMALCFLYEVVILLIYPQILIGLLAINVFSYLMFKWFFFEKKMRQSLPLALYTHHPIVFIEIFYLVECFSAINNIQVQPLTYINALAYGLMFTLWEFSRKMRLPFQEGTYRTYTKIWGLKKPTYLSILCILITGSLSAKTLFVHHQIKILMLFCPLLIFFITCYLVFVKHKRILFSLKSLSEAYLIFINLIMLICFYRSFGQTIGLL